MMDQAENLRNMIRKQNQNNIKNARVIAITSGKAELESLICRLILR